MQSEIRLSFTLAEGVNEYGFVLSNDLGENYRFYYDANKDVFSRDRSRAGISDFSDNFAGKIQARRLSREGLLTINAFIDSATIEFFIDQGNPVFTETFFPTTPYNAIEIIGRGQLVEATLYPLASSSH